MSNLEKLFSEAKQFLGEARPAIRAEQLRHFIQTAETWLATFPDQAAARRIFAALDLIRRWDYADFTDSRMIQGLIRKAIEDLVVVIEGQLNSEADQANAQAA